MYITQSFEENKEYFIGDERRIIRMQTCHKWGQSKNNKKWVKYEYK